MEPSKSFTVQFKDQFDNLPLHAASVNGNKDCVALLLEKGSECNVKNDMEHTPLHLAVLNGKAEVTNLILRYEFHCKKLQFLFCLNLAHL